MKKILNVALLSSALACFASGLIIQIFYHLIKRPASTHILLFNQASWNSIHVWSSLVFLFFVIYHVVRHKKWYKSLFKNKFSTKKRPTGILSVLMIITAITGLIPWYIAFFGENSDVRFLFIEIHDKIAVLLLIVCILHTRKRLKFL